MQEYVVGQTYEIDTVYVGVNPDMRNRFMANDDLPIEDLVASFKKDGQKTPAPAYVSSPGRVTLIGGNRRLETCKRLNRKLAVRIVDKPKDTKEEAIARYDDNIALHFSVMDKAVQMHELRKAGCTLADTAKRFVNAAGKQITPQYVSMCLNLLDLIPEAQLLIHRGVKGCGSKWGIDVGKRPAVEQLRECEVMAKGEDDIYSKVVEQLEQHKIQSPQQVAEDEAPNLQEQEGDGNGAGTGTKTQPQHKTSSQRTLTHVKELLTAICDSRTSKLSDRVMDNIKPEDMATVLLDFCNDRDRGMVECVQSLHSNAKLKARLQSIAITEAGRKKSEKEEKEAREKKAAGDKAAAQEGRESLMREAVAGLLMAKWIPMAHKPEEGPKKWKDPMNDKSKFVDTAEAWMTELSRRVAKPG